MLENRRPGERPDRHPAAGTGERTSPRFGRDRSRQDACPTVRPRCFGVRPGFSGSEIAEQLRRGVHECPGCPMHDYFERCRAGTLPHTATDRGAALAEAHTLRVVNNPAPCPGLGRNYVRAGEAHSGSEITRGLETEEI